MDNESLASCCARVLVCCYVGFVGAPAGGIGSALAVGHSCRMARRPCLNPLKRALERMYIL
jgi:hypothetical protein